MQARHLLKGILHAIFGFLWFSSIKEENGTITVKKKFLGLFSAEGFPVTFNSKEADISFFVTQWGPFKTYNLIVDGGYYFVKQSLYRQLEHLLTQRAIPLASLVYSMDYPKEPQYVVQIGKESLYEVGKIHYSRCWSYDECSFNIADLGKKNWKFLLINTLPIALPNNVSTAQIEDALKSKGAHKDPYLVSPMFIESKGFSASLFGNKYKRYPYLLLGNKLCYRERQEMNMEDIVYFDNNESGEVHFGTGIDFYYPQLSQQEINGIREYFISKGAELHANGKTYTTRITWRPSTWFRKHRQSVTLGKRGLFYTRKRKGVDKTSFIPYHDIYFINRIGWRLWGRKLEMYGSQNIETFHTFKNKDYIEILERIYSINPRLKEAYGKKYRSFSWNPFKRRSYVIIGEGMLMHGHPKLKQKVALEGKYVKDSKKYGRFYHLFKDVVIGTVPSNLRYDEGVASVDLSKFTSGTKINPEDSWLLSAYNPIFCVHLWCRTATRLVTAVSSVRGMESSFRADYLNSEQAVKDQQAREKQMAEFADKSSLIEFMSELRTKTHCDNIQPGGQMAARVSDDDKDSVSTDTAANNVNIQNDRIVDEDHNGNINYSDSESVVAGNAEADDKIQPQVNLPSSIRLLKGKRGWYAVAAAVILIVVGGLIWYFVGSYHDDSHESVQQSENIESEITKNDEDPATLITSEEVEQVNEDENETGMAEYESTDLINYVLKGTIGVSPVTMRLIDMEDALDERGTMWKHTGKLTYKGSGVELKLDGYMKRQYLILEAYDSKGNKAGHIELVGRDFEDGKSGYEGNYDDTNGNSVPVRLIDETVY